MDAEKLIEEAERWAKNVSESPGNGTAGEDLYGAKLLISLAAALRETTARAEKQKQQFDEALRDLMDGHAEEIRKRGLSDAVTAETYDACHAALRQTEEERDRERQRADAAEFDATALRAAFKIADHTSLVEEMRKGLTTAYELAKMARERDDLAAANLAANKRIEELEHERDAARRQAQENAEHALDIAKERDAARAELARLTTPRPIAERPASGKIRGIWLDGNGKVEREEVVHVSDGYMRDWHDEPFFCPIMGDPTHYLPLPVLP